MSKQSLQNELYPIVTRADLAQLVFSDGITRHLDVDKFIDKGPDKIGGRNWHGPCPRCGGRDRFSVSNGLFYCRKCGYSGRITANMLGVASATSVSFEEIRRKREEERRRIAEHARKVREFLNSGVVEAMQRALLRNKWAMNWIRQKWGFELLHVKTYHLGFKPDLVVYNGKTGERVVAKAIAFPHIFHGRVRAMTMRLMANEKELGKYRPWPKLGFSVPYVIERGHVNLLVVEGQAKAITLASALPHDWSVFAVTGVNAMSKHGMPWYVRWVASSFDRVYILFDEDQPQIVKAAVDTANRIARVAAGMGRTPYVAVPYPVGKPDDVLREGKISPDGLLRHITNSVPVFAWPSVEREGGEQ